MYKVMQRCETGEVFCAAECDDENTAYTWLANNAENYPESNFWVEPLTFWFESY